ncbi:DNA topoisomerase IB [Corynebacterium halotolerans]|uniref:DNA topoisomerase n=1 Tax=Corynebacterium halotolerans YIM 70093 = DSM 44683 TaxID=1121362 RepID=M1NPC0_9CORY|nr:DNA topoisomerase IB [Corynebacterium halotolerans]AGF71362.1 DNA topoisomerase [Corynebacterium halotolerans YIM 70093 = DSM 44683]
MSSSSGPRRVRLRRSDPSGPCITRRRRGKGWSFHLPDGTKVDDPDELERLRGLAVPPAWTEVWICPFPNGHIQATGVDDAGRKQYIYHSRWKERQADKKFDHVLDVGDALPAARPKVTRLLHREETDLAKACAVAFRLFDTTGIRVGNEEYAEENGSYGLTTMLVTHVRLDGDTVHLEFPAKSGQHVSVETRDADLAEALAPMLARHPDDTAIAHREGDTWCPLTSAQVNDFLKEITGVDMTAKDFRTWHGTVIAARELARRFEPEATQKDRKRAVKESVEAVAEHLQNTATIARNSYVDPRVIDLFHEGEVIEAGTYRQAERALREFLTS